MRKKGYIHKLKPPIGVHLTFHLKGRLKKDEDTIPHDKKPDLDNMIKYDLDVFMGLSLKMIDISQRSKLKRLFHAKTKRL